MVSKNKAYASLSVSLLVLMARFFLYTTPENFMVVSPLLITYCLLDIRNSRDMIIHHISTIVLNITFYYVAVNNSRLTKIEAETFNKIIKAFLDVEFSTVFLALIHLGYRHLAIKLAFFLLFGYYRIFNLTWLITVDYQPSYLSSICQTSNICYLSWYLGCYPIIILNYYWYYLIIGKAFKVKK